MISPPWETSLMKGLPIASYNREFMATLRAFYGFPLRVKFRGPRSQRLRCDRQRTCLRKDAVTFAVYPRDGWKLLSVPVYNGPIMGYNR